MTSTLEYAIHHYQDNTKLLKWLDRSDFFLNEEEKDIILKEILLGDFAAWDGSSVSIISNPSYKYPITFNKN